MDDLAPLGRLIEAVRPWLSELVIIGGWAHRLHRLHPKAASLPYLPLQTRDADIAFSLTAQLEGSIGAALKQADFREDFRGEYQPPVTQYRLGDEDQGFYVEFLAPLVGGGVRRDGTPDATVGKAGVTAQKLRHLDVLLLQPWNVRLDSTVAAPLVTPANVRIANPVSFLAQKLLIHKYRPPDKQAQDVLYVHDTLELFGGALQSLRTEWQDILRPRLAAPTVDSIERLRLKQFASVTDVIRAAARIPQDRTLAADHLQRACSYGLDEIFGAA